MKNKNFLRKYAVLLAFAVSAIVFLPEALLAKGAVIGYAWGNSDVSDEQLDRLTHLMVYDMYVETNGDIIPNPDWEQYVPPGTTWVAQLNTLVSRAHEKGVKVSIVISHGDNYYYNFDSATQGANRTNFVNKIASLVSTSHLDGVDIDWECPGLDGNWEALPNPDDRIREWNQCIALLTGLRDRFNELNMSNKRISIALPAYEPNNTDLFPIQTTPNLPFPQRIWNAVDAIHLMTYDMRHVPNHSHSDVSDAINIITSWASFGKEKLLMGCAFYGYNKDANNTIWKLPSGNDPRVPYHTNGSTCGNPSDTPASVQNKVSYCYENGYGGVLIWELGQDKIVNNTPELQDAIWTKNTAKGGYNMITITTQPAATTAVIQGSISGSLSVTASCAEGLIYQWYKNTANSNTGGTVVQGATNASFPIPTNLAAGTHYYYCIVNTKRTNVAKVVVSAPSPPPPPVISGPTLVCTSGSQFTVTNAGGATVTWTYSSNLQVVDGNTGSTKSFKATSNNGASGWVKATNTGGSVQKNVWVGRPKVFLPAVSNTINWKKNTPLRCYMDIENEVLANPTSFQWIVTGSHTNVGFNPNAYNRIVDITFYYAGYYEMEAVAINSCGTSVRSNNVYVIVSDNSYYSMAYPNPASNTLNIEIDQEAYTQAKSLEQTATDAKQLKKEPAYDFRLYDKQGNIVLRAQNKGGTVQFNVSNLPAGIYYLHVYDGISEKPEIQQIMVER